MSEKPQIKHNDELYQLLRKGKVEEFNARKAAGETIDLVNSDFRGINLRGLDAAGLDLSDCYFRQADLRGLDLSSTKLDGASFHSAKISGSLFPDDFSADEINLSLEHGTRLRRGK